jgi:two-component system response regulator DesR
MTPSLSGILIVEDEGMFRECLVARFREAFPHMELRACGSAEEALALCDSRLPLLGLFDLNLPGVDGVDLGQQLLARAPNMRVVILSGRSSEALLLRLRGSKIAGFIDKNDEHIDALPALIASVLDGHRYYSRSLRDFQLGFARTSDAWSKLLTDTEIKILPFLGANLRPTEIAALFHISEDTVYWHKKNIRSKLNLQSDTDLMHFCTMKGFLLIGRNEMRPVQMPSPSKGFGPLPGPRLPLPDLKTEL